MEIPTVLLRSTDPAAGDTILGQPSGCPPRSNSGLPREDPSKLSTRFRNDIFFPTQLNSRNAAGSLTQDP